MSLDLGPVLTDQLPALETATTSNMVGVNLNALHTTRKSFMEAEASEKIQRSLRSNVKTYADEGFVTGESVYYRRQNCKGWHDPAKALNKEEGKSVCTDQIWKCILQDASMSLEGKQFGSPRDGGNKISLNEINEVLEEDERLHNKSTKSKSEGLKHNTEKTL